MRLIRNASVELRRSNTVGLQADIKVAYGMVYIFKTSSDQTAKFQTSDKTGLGLVWNTVLALVNQSKLSGDYRHNETEW